MKYSNYHTHTTFCDGIDSPEDLVLEAIRLGCPEIGFSGHSHHKEDSGSMTPEATHRYCAEIHRLQEKYAGQIRILLGLELDCYSKLPIGESFNYIIGAVHYVEKDGTSLPVDESRDLFLHAVNTAYHGDIYAFAEDYYAAVADVWRRTDCEIIAHFDLFTKYNEGNCLFDTGHPRYVAAADAALDALLGSHAILEINTGAMARGYRYTPYPEKRILERWLDAGRSVILAADCHDKRQLLFAFEDVARDFPKPEQLLMNLPFMGIKRI